MSSPNHLTPFARYFLQPVNVTHRQYEALRAFFVDGLSSADIAERFGTDVAKWVAALTKDMRLEDELREVEYHRVLATSDWPVTICKLADIFDNLLDSRNTPPEKQRNTFKRSHAYLQALQTDLKPEARPHWNTVAELLKRIEG